MNRTRKSARGVLAGALIVAAAVAGFTAGLWHGRAAHARLAHPAARAPGFAPAAHGGTTIRTGRERRTMTDTLPDVAFRDPHGTVRHFAHWRGHPLLVNFWAPWCSPCRAEIPLLERLNRTRPQGVEVIGVGVDGRAAVLRYAHRSGIRYPLLIGLRPGMRVIRQLGMVAAFPFSVFVDARGRIVTVRVGQLHAAQAALILNRIGALDRGQIDLATARRQINSGLERIAAHDAQTATNSPDSAQS